MKLNQTELDEHVFIQASHLNSLLGICDSTEAEASLEVEESQSLENLKNERDDPNCLDLIRNCEAAIASYLKQVEAVGDKEKTPSIEQLNDLQQRVIEAIDKRVRYQGHEVQVVESCRKPCQCCYVIPTYLMQKVHQIDAIREKVIGQENEASSSVQSLSIKEAVSQTAGKEPIISVYTAKHGTKLPGAFLASNKKANGNMLDDTAKKAFEGAKDVYAFWMKNYGLWSFDGYGSEIRSTIHYDYDYANAFWNGEQMVYGDGDDIFTNFTELSIVAHEFGHAVTGDKLNYEGEAGALNEHLSDVWGSLVLQFKKNQTADQASWLIGEGVIQIDHQSYALRSMKNPGSAYNSPVIGKDPQPDHYAKRYIGKEDDGGVHINSGIPNKAFYLFAQAQGGYAWQKAGYLWYLTLKSDLIKPNCTMPEFAHATLVTALKHFPQDYKMHQDLINAWKAVGLA